MNLGPMNGAETGRTERRDVGVGTSHCVVTGAEKMKSMKMTQIAPTDGREDLSAED